MTRLTKIEKETIILFNEGESTASIYTYNVGLKKRLAAFSKKYPDLCCLEKPEHLGGVSYLIDKSRLHPLAAAIQRGAQAESQSVRPAKWFQRQDKVMHR